MSEGSGTIEVGYWVALSLRPGTAPLRCYVGEVQAVDERGIRLTLLDWLIGKAVGNDFFAPWDSITSMLVCTPQHDLEGFVESARKWQDNMQGMGQEQTK